MNIGLLSPKQEVWVLSNYPVGAGGFNALLGVARRFAERTDLDLRIHDYKTIELDFKSAIQRVTENLPKRLQLEPSLRSQRRSWWVRDLALKETASELFYRTHGLPTAILSSFDTYFTSNRLYQGLPTTISTPSDLFLASGLDTMSWSRYLPEGLRGLAPHNQSSEDLQNEAKRFFPILKGDGKQLIALVAADSNVSTPSLIGNLVDLINAYPKARFLLSSSPRCPSDDFNVFCNRIHSRLNPEQRASLVVYDFRADAKESNPYKACLTLADHMIILGSSESMVSERLFAGRSVYYGYGYGAEVIERCFGTGLAETGKIKYFPAHSPLMTEHFVPIDTTEAITDQLVKDYQKRQKLVPKKDTNPMLETIKNKMRRALVPDIAP